MKKTLIAFLTITILPILAYGYVNESACKDINNCPAGCGILPSAGTAPKCDICPAGTYSTTSHNTCQSCGQLPNNTSAATFEWYSDGAENEGECKFKYTCASNAIYLSSLTTTSGIHISDKETYSNPCRACGLNSYPNANQTACVCKTGTYVKGTTNDTETTNGTDCIPYIITIATNNPDDIHLTSQSIDVLTTLDQDTYLYYLTIKDIDSPITISYGDKLYSPSSLRKVLWGDKEKVYENHIDTGYKIKSWSDSKNPSKEFTSAAFSNITTNYSLRPNWVGKTFQIKIQHPDDTSTTATECQYNSTKPQCTINVPTRSGHTFLHWSCLTHDYKKNEISCTTPDIHPVNGTSPDLSNVSYGNDIVLTENWEPNKITLYYKDSLNPQLESTSTYNYGETTKPGEPEDIWKGTYVKPHGQEFTGWQCTRVDGYKQPLAQYGNCGIISATENIATKFDSGYILLTAQYDYESYDCNSGEYLPANSTECTACPAGYYCQGDRLTFNKTVPQGIESCPAGSTSDGSTSESKSDDITDCYITNQTQICDNSNTCFQIPEGIKIHHNKINHN